jgi:hypothetical protein
VGALAAGIGGIGVLADGAGDDVYRGGPVSLGTGVLGVGLLLDASGHDLYEATRVGQGAAFLGVGGLFDARGNDTYRMGLYGQGFGGVGGVGVLRDYEGGDRYLASPLVVDVIRYEAHHDSFLQGASLGNRPDQSGGIGLLLDDEGNDLYDADIFGQGTAYWFGLGVLLDRKGHDVYAGYQYAQGAGIHYGLGLLLDEAGEDTYRARGVSQGCGHDRGAGMLVDERGNDAYVSFDLSQGAGSANGTGVFIDRSGSDAYVVRDAATSLGYGNPRNGSGSVGLFLDLRGEDAYAKGGRDSTLWWGSEIGSGVDIPEPLSREEVWPDDPKVPVTRREYTIDEFFVLASAAPPKYSLVKEYAIGELASRGPAIGPDLLPYFASRIPREQLGIRDVFRRIGEPSVGFLTTVLDTASSLRARSAAHCLGEIGAASAIPSLTNAFERDAPLRAEAALALGKIARKATATETAGLVPLLAPLLADSSLSVRRAGAFALGALGGEAAPAALVQALDDSFVGVRLAARSGLQSMRERATPGLAARIRQPGLGREWALMVLEHSRDPQAAAALVAVEGEVPRWAPRERVAFAKAVAGHPESDRLQAIARALSADGDWRVAAAARRGLR